MKSTTEFMEDLPTILTPVYITKQPNEAIPLSYEGTIELTQKIESQEVQDSEIVESGTCKLEFNWFPYPSIHFSFLSSTSAWPFDPTKEFKLKLCSGSNINYLDVGVANIRSPNGVSGNQLTGRVKGSVSRGTEQNLSYLIFHVVNLQKLHGCPVKIGKTKIRKSRISLNTEDWEITIDQSEIISELEQNLNSKGGFAITHVGRLKRLDSNLFTASEAEEILDALSDFLSFLRGFQIPIVFLSGYDKDSRKTWEKWTQPVGDPWQNINSWLPANRKIELAELFQSFMNKWRNEKKELKLNIYWYARIGITPSVETAIILTQIALEKIAYAEGFTKIASVNIGSLLDKYKIPKSFPSQYQTQEIGALANSLQATLEVFKSPFVPSLEALEKAASFHKWEDGPHALIKLRNDIAHARQDYTDLEPQVFFDVCALGLWYLELILLATLGYQGSYNNRLNNNIQGGQTETVPWL
ncbi:MAG: hypothetical protein ACFCU8_03400 [Thermosynechococcaceae cyanobacterium]